MEEAFYNISMYLYNKNDLEYAHIARNETESKIPYIKGCSSLYMMTVSEFKLIHTDQAMHGRSCPFPGHCMAISNFVMIIVVDGKVNVMI